MKILLGALVGAAVGGIVGWRGRCRTGVCPLTSNPYIGGLYGALLGMLIAGAVACSSGSTAMESSERGDTNVMAETQETNVIKLVNAKDFDRTVLQSSVPVIVDLWAPWCGPCRIQGPILEEFAQQHGAAVKVVRINVDEHPDLSRRFQVRAIPTLLIFEQGQEKKRLVGVHSLEDLKKAMAL